MILAMGIRACSTGDGSKTAVRKVSQEVRRREEPSISGKFAACKEAQARDISSESLGKISAEDRNAAVLFIPNDINYPSSPLSSIQK